MKTMFLLCATLVCQVVCGQDSLIVTGQIENLTARMYRAADAVQITRVNLIRGREEISYNVPLNVDGSFSAKIPLVAPTEECMLVYGRWINSPFLAQKGSINVKIFADSLRTGTNALRFEGVLASTNNRRIVVETLLTNLVETDKSFKNITKKLDNRTPSQAWTFLRELQNKKISLFDRLQRNKPQDELLNTWLKSSIEEATKASFYDYLGHFGYKVPTILLDSIKISLQTLHTFARVDAAQQFFRYIMGTTTTNITSLKASSMAGLLLRYTSNLTQSERNRLGEIIAKNAILTKDLRFLNTLFERDKGNVGLFSTYELAMRQLTAVTDSTTLDLLRAKYWASASQNITIDNVIKLYKHLGPDIKTDLYKKSLDEIYRLTAKDSVQLLSLKNIVIDTDYTKRMAQASAEIAPNVYLYKNELLTGRQIFEKLKVEHYGKYLYILYWDISNLESREALKICPELRKTIPESQMEFVYVCQSQAHEGLLKELLYRYNLRGTHVLCANNEQDQFWTDSVTLLREMQPYCAILNDKGVIKYSYDAPIPQDYEGWEKVSKALKLP